MRKWYNSGRITWWDRVANVWDGRLDVHIAMLEATIKVYSELPDAPKFEVHASINSDGTVEDHKVIWLDGDNAPQRPEGIIHYP